MHNIAKCYQFRPSSLLELPYNSWEAYLVDAQCYVAGIENEQEQDDKVSHPNRHSTGTNNSDININPWLNIGNVRTISDPTFTGIW
jgi:hypothetical protein